MAGGIKTKDAALDNFSASQVTLATGAAQLIVAARQGRSEVRIVNTSTVLPAYIGTSTISKTTGFALMQTRDIVFKTSAAVYGTVSDVAGAVVSYVEVF